MISTTKKLGKELIKEASPEHKLKIYTYVRVSTTAVLLIKTQHTNKKHTYKQNAATVGYALVI